MKITIKESLQQINCWEELEMKKLKYDVFSYKDIDECTSFTHNCNSNATCNNTDGSFTCACNSGYTGDGINCTGMCWNTNNVIV
jgi:hypothetical protein